MQHSQIITEPDKREAMRQVIAESGTVVKVREHERQEHPDSPSRWVGYMGWEDYDAAFHLEHEDCSLHVPLGVQVIEASFEQFAGTDVPGYEIHGLLAWGGPEGSDQEIRCTCGKHRGLLVMYRGTLSDLIMATLAKLTEGGQPLDATRGFTL